MVNQSVPSTTISKEAPVLDAFAEELGLIEEDVALKSTPADTAAMKRLGRKQELVRHFRSLSMISFVALATSAWETNIFVFTQGLINGGRPAVMYSLLWCFVGFIPIYLSMAEMASMGPIAG